MNSLTLHRALAALVTVAVTAVLGACGGGGGGGGGISGPSERDAGSSSTPTTLKGIFADGPVSGIGYRTSTGSGTTNATGEFSYSSSVPNEQVTFFIGAVDLPAVAASAVITPLQIAKAKDINNQVVTNILILLQSLDADGNPANGIDIPATAAAAVTSPIDFNVSPGVFAANPAVVNLVANSGSTNKVVVSASVAQAHFVKTLNGAPGVPKINVAPDADAGKAQSVLVGAKVILNGSQSFDANGDPLTYAWTLSSKPSGSNAALTNPTSAAPSFTADVAGNYLASLAANDGTLDSNAATVTVTATAAGDNAAPVANAGAVQSVASATRRKRE